MEFDIAADETSLTQNNPQLKQNVEKFMKIVDVGGDNAISFLELENAVTGHKLNAGNVFENSSSVRLKNSTGSDMTFCSISRLRCYDDGEEEEKEGGGTIGVDVGVGVGVGGDVRTSKEIHHFRHKNRRQSLLRKSIVITGFQNKSKGEQQMFEKCPDGSTKPITFASNFLHRQRDSRTIEEDFVNLRIAGINESLDNEHEHEHEHEHEPEHELEHEPGHEHDTKHCTLCSKKFTFRVRKHHCRKCGELVCDTCSKGRLVLPSLYGDDPVRVCTQCSDGTKSFTVSSAIAEVNNKVEAKADSEAEAEPKSETDPENWTQIDNLRISAFQKLIVPLRSDETDSDFFSDDICDGSGFAPEIVVDPHTDILETVTLEVSVCVFGTLRHITIITLLTHSFPQRQIRSSFTIEIHTPVDVQIWKTRLCKDDFNVKRKNLNEMLEEVACADTTIPNIFYLKNVQPGERVPIPLSVMHSR